MVEKGEILPKSDQHKSIQQLDPIYIYYLFFLKSFKVGCYTTMWVCDQVKKQELSLLQCIVVLSTQAHNDFICPTIVQPKYLMGTLSANSFCNPRD
jgi:hypothetical protein